MKVGMAEWSKSLPPVRGSWVRSSVMTSWEQAAPVRLCFDRWYQTGICVSVSLVGRQLLSENGSPPSSRVFLPACFLIACVAANDCAIL